jgi:hypothetical protein
MLEEFLRITLIDIYRTASQWTDTIQDTASDEAPNYLRDRLVELQIGAIVNIFSLVDGTIGPTVWPGVKLVNAETGKSLSDDLCWELSRIESTILDESGPDSEV